MQIENQIMKFFNSNHLDKIGKILLSKTTIFKENSNNFLIHGAPPRSLRFMHSVINPHPNHFAPPQKCPNCDPDCVHFCVYVLELCSVAGYALLFVIVGNLKEIMQK